jgi:hypothetical protein
MLFIGPTQHNGPLTGPQSALSLFVPRHPPTARLHRWHTAAGRAPHSSPRTRRPGSPLRFHMDVHAPLLLYVAWNSRAPSLSISSPRSHPSRLFKVHRSSSPSGAETSWSLCRRAFSQLTVFSDEDIRPPPCPACSSKTTGAVAAAVAPFGRLGHRRWSRHASRPGHGDHPWSG